MKGKAALGVMCAVSMAVSGCAGAGAGSPRQVPGPASTTASAAGSEAPAIVVVASRSTLATIRRDPTYGTCRVERPATTNDDVAARVGEVAGACAAATRMHRVGDTLRGPALGAISGPQSFPVSLEGNHCYRVYAVAAATIRDLDVRIVDSAGRLIVQDETDDGTPIVPSDGAVCFRDPDHAEIQVAIGAGNGDYAVQLWSD